MPRYMDTAAQANVVAKRLVEMVPDEDKPKVAEMIAQLVNLGVRCSPRAVMGTVRLNAVRRAVQDLPVEVSMEKRKDPKTLRDYNLLVTKQVVAGHLNGQVTVEDASSDEE